MILTVLVFFLSVVCARFHFTSAVAFLIPIVLLGIDRTVMVPGLLGIAFVVMGAISFLTLFFLERRKRSPQDKAFTIVRLSLIVVRFIPIWVYLGDLSFRIQNHWTTVTTTGDRASLGFAVGFMMMVPVAICIVLSGILIWRLKKQENR